jgi:tetratricopeptide (TPR) repeat protein
MSAFSAGPRLLDSPKGDPKRQAIASLRGYAYQLYVSALAWLSLKQGEHLYLEVAEDYATVTKNALEGVQVKDTHQSGNITINSSDVRNTIDAYVDLHERNPNYVVSLRFLSTSSIGQEQEKASRANDEPVLTYWRRAALGAEIAPLRSALGKANLSNRVRQFIDSRDDTSLRKDLLQRIHWDCSRPDLASVRDELRASLIEYGNDKFRMAPSESERLASTVLERVLDSILTSEARRLSAADLLKVFEDSTHVSLPRSTFDAVLQQMSKVVVGGEEGPSFVARSVLEPEHELPVPKYLTKRDAIVARVLGSIQQHGIAFITGSTGFGKTLAARLATRDLGGTWYVLDLRNTSVPESVQLLRRAIGKLATIDLDGLILDDLNEAEAPEVAREVVRLAAALRRRDIRWIATAYREPSARFMESIGGDAGSHIPIPSFEEAEVAELVAQAGGAVSTWAKLIYMAGGFGHPQLVQALIDGLHTRSWSADDLRELCQLQFINSDVQHEREAARRYLVGTMDDGTRTLLYRTSLLFGRFDRGLALRIGETDPNITNPGEKLDALLGPWIDAVSHGELRISPLVENVGRDMLTREAQLDVHRTAADYITDGESLDILKANSAYLHGLLGNSETALVKIGYAVVRTSTKKRRRLVDWLSGLRFARVDRPIYSNPTIARLLRFSQLLLVAETDDDAKVREVWDVLGKELQNEQNPKLRATFESMVLGSVLINQYLAGVLPNWVDLVLRFDSLAKSDRLLGKMVRSFERTSKPPGGPRSVLGFLFINQALNVRSVAELASVFSKLDSLPADTRDTLFKDVFSMPGDFSLIVSNAWSREHKLGTLDWRTAADQYLSMGRIANLWGYRDLAIRCRVAVGVMLDEYGDDPAAALKALDEAAVAHGDDPVISRARAKIFYRRKDHAAALSLLKENAELIGANDPIERAYMLREAGISAAELGDWAEARTWFQKSAESAAHIKSSTLKTVVTGLRADAAVAILKSGDRVGALGEIVSAIESLESLDPEESIRAAYCHRVVRHTVLWMQGEMTGKIISVENEPPAMLPGMCSNPEPSEEIKSHPLTPIEPSGT